MNYVDVVGETDQCAWEIYVCIPTCNSVQIVPCIAYDIVDVSPVLALKYWTDERGHFTQPWLKSVFVHLRRWRNALHHHPLTAGTHVSIRSSVQNLSKRRSNELLRMHQRSEEKRPRTVKSYIVLNLIIPTFSLSAGSSSLVPSKFIATILQELCITASKSKCRLRTLHLLSVRPYQSTKCCVQFHMRVVTSMKKHGLSRDFIRLIKQIVNDPQGLEPTSRSACSSLFR